MTNDNHENVSVKRTVNFLEKFAEQMTSATKYPHTLWRLGEWKTWMVNQHTQNAIKTIIHKKKHDPNEQWQVYLQTNMGDLNV